MLQCVSIEAYVWCLCSTSKNICRFQVLPYDTYEVLLLVRACQSAPAPAPVHVVVESASSRARFGVCGWVRGRAKKRERARERAVAREKERKRERVLVKSERENSKESE